MQRRADLGETCRNLFLQLVAHRHENKQVWPGIDMMLALDIGRRWPSVEAYLEHMKKVPVKDPSQWGGYGEAALISYDWTVIVAIFAKGDRELHLQTRWARTMGDMFRPA